MTIQYDPRENDCVTLARWHGTVWHGVLSDKMFWLLAIANCTLLVYTFLLYPELNSVPESCLTHYNSSCWAPMPAFECATTEYSRATVPPTACSSHIRGACCSDDLMKYSILARELRVHHNVELNCLP